MKYFNKIGFDPGHYAGANIGPGSYREGDVMLQFGLALQAKYGSFLTRNTGVNLTLKQRGVLAKNAGCDMLISLHTNAPEKFKGIKIFYPKSRTQDYSLAVSLGQALAKATGIKFEGAKTRTFTDGVTDYYGVIRDGLRVGLKSVFIVEHGSHWEFAVDTQKKIAACVDVYGKFFDLPSGGMTYEQALKIISEAAGTSADYWLARKDIDKWFEKYNKDIAKAFQKLKGV